MGKYFGTDGIRGVAGVTLTNEIAYKIGLFLGNYYKERKILIGKDTRISSTMLENSLVSGILAGGCDAYILGYCSTPALAYITKNDKFEVGVMISASHNPYYDNGIKIFSNTGVKLDEEILLKIEDFIDDKITLKINYDKEIGSLYNYEYRIKTYIDYILNIFPDDLSEFKVLLDLSNGSNIYTAKDVFNLKKIDAKFINDESNGININDGCGSTHLENLITQIKQKKYDIGFAYDGDGDRVLAVSSNGDVIDGDKLMYVIAKYLKSKNQLNKNTLVTTKMSNIGLFKALKENDIKAEIVDVGDKYVLEKLNQDNYSLGGEQSGHIINMNYNNFGDGLLISILILTIMKESGSDILSLTNDIKIYPQLLKNIKVKDKNKVLNSVVIKNRINEIQNIMKDEGRIFVRPSGTEPLIRVMVEAKSNEECEQYVNEVIELIKNEENN